MMARSIVVAPHAGTEKQGPETTPKRTYTLRYDDDALGLSKRIEFEAESPAIALEIAQGEADGRQAVLLVDGQPLCQLAKAPAEDGPFWIIKQQGAAGPPS